MTGIKYVHLNNMVWSGLVWSGLVWSGLVWSGLVWSGLVWSGLVWSGLVWSGLVWSGLVWSGLVWSGMVWYGMVWYGMVWHGIWYGIWYGVVSTILPYFVMSEEVVSSILLYFARLVSEEMLVFLLLQLSSAMSGWVENLISLHFEHWALEVTQNGLHSGKKENEQLYEF